MRWRGGRGISGGGVSGWSVSSGGWLAGARVVWLAIALLSVVLFAASLPAYHAEFLTLSIIHNASYRELARANLEHMGLSVEFYAWYYVALGVVLASVCFVVGAVIFWRRSYDRMALLVSLLLVLFGATFPGSIQALGKSYPALSWLNGFLGSLSFMLVFVFFYLFPNGRFVPRWTRWAALLLVAYTVLASLFPGSRFIADNWPALPYTLFLMGWLLTGVVAQVHRYRRVSRHVERQQTKWVAFGFALAIAGYLGVIALQVVFPSLQPGTFADFASATASIGFMLLIPLSVGVSILRYRLFDIDFIINRTLVYGLLTAMLLALYIGGTVVLQYALLALIGQKSELAVVASTLAIAVLFSPLRGRTQAFIDHRFYRDKYDARKMLSAFGARLRDETDLRIIKQDLLTTVRETMQPEHVSLWLCKPEGKEK